MGRLYRIPLFDLNYGREEEEAVLRVIKSKWLSQGPETEAFEREFADYVGSKHAVAVSSGTAALHISYICAGIKPGDEVIVPSFTFIATVTPLLWIGAKPVFADIKSIENPNICAETVEPLITRRTKAVVFVHYAGFTDGIDEIRNLCREKNLILIEDASHAHGSKAGNRFAGTFGRIGAFSLFANKNLAVGEGGMIITDDEVIFRKARLLRSHGMTKLAWDKFRGSSDEYDVVELGYNYRMNELQAALGRVQLSKLDKANERRRKLVALYREELDGYVVIPFKDFESSANYIFPIMLPEEVNRRDASKYLRKKGIQTSHHYKPVHLFSLMRRTLGTVEGMLPRTEEAGRRELTLPLYPTMTEDDVLYVVDVLKQFLGR